MKNLLHFSANNPWHQLGLVALVFLLCALMGLAMEGLDALVVMP